jgi:3-oxoacyl-[acyl-carrier protein] reductase
MDSSKQAAMDLGITRKTAIVTGAATGIGRAIAEEYAQNGVRLVIIARGAEHLGATAEAIRQRFGTDVLALAADVADPAEPDRIVRSTMERFGSVDIRVNNAGRAHGGGIMDVSEEDWQDMTETKLSAMRRFCRAAIPHMRERHWGRIVNISSIGGIYPNYKLMVSHVLSAAINNLTRSLALEVARDGILVNAIGVGAVLTDNWANNMLPGVRKRRPELAGCSDAELMKILGEEMTPVGRFGRPDEIAALAAFLASDRNGFVTGDTVEASGGADRFM